MNMGLGNEARREKTELGSNGNKGVTLMGKKGKSLICKCGERLQLQQSSVRAVV